MANSDDDTVLKALIDIAENAAKYLRPAIDEVFNLCPSNLVSRELKHDEITST